MKDFILPNKKIMTLDQAVEWRNALRRAGKTLSVTNGCFDLLHRGHAEYLQTAATLADCFLVLVNSDASVRRLKGPSRPINCEYDRAYLLGCFSFIDAVVVFDNQRCTNELIALQPDAYAKGGDYTIETLEESERNALLAAKTKISFIPFVPDHSTTRLIEKSKGV